MQKKNRDKISSHKFVSFFYYQLACWTVKILAVFAFLLEEYSPEGSVLFKFSHDDLEASSLTPGLA